MQVLMSEPLTRLFPKSAKFASSLPGLCYHAIQIHETSNMMMKYTGRQGGNRHFPILQASAQTFNGIGEALDALSHIHLLMPTSLEEHKELQPHDALNIKEVHDTR